MRAKARHKLYRADLHGQLLYTTCNTMHGMASLL